MSLFIRSHIFAFIAFALLLHPIKAKDEPLENSYSTSVAGMMKLVLLEAKLVENLSNYTEKLQKKFDVLERIVPLLQAESDKAMKQMEDYIANPLNAFSLIRRMHMDWPAWKIFMDTLADSSHATFIDQHKAELTTLTDLQEACEAIERLRVVYNLTTGDMAKGLLNGTQYDTSLNALDSYALAQYLHRHKAEFVAKEWFAESAKWLINHTLPTPTGGENAKMLHLFANALKHYSIALPLFDRALEMGNSTNNPEQLKKRNELKLLVQEEPVLKPNLNEDNDIFAAGCRGEFKPRTNLYCEYKFKTSPFLRLAPLKVEVLLLDPYVAAFYDVLSPHEIAVVQDLSRPLLVRSKVGRYGKLVMEKTRTSHGTFIRADIDNVTKRIEKRIEDMTDLGMEGFEPANVLNYGLGGHYGLHNDYISNISPQDLAVYGNRVATALLYLSDVEQGGATVFPKLKLSVSPKRGKALFWYNMHSNGSSDLRTRHGGCPVLVGSKWVMTKWIRERAQFLKRPCPKINSI